MNPGAPLPDPPMVAEALAAARDRLATALWLSAGMLCALGSTVCQALSRRRGGLAFALLYGLSLCFVRNGHAQVLGPLGMAAALAGLLAGGKEDAR